MKVPLDIHGRIQVTRWCRAALSLMVTLIWMATLGCGTQQAEQEPAVAQGTGGTKTVTAEAAPTQTEEIVPPVPKESPASVTTRVHLSDKGCVEFEPHWTSVAVGQSLSWQSELKSPVTIHISPGAFDKEAFVARPGAIVSTGPARKTGSFSIWAEPTACQGVPRGVQSSGPGVTVKSAPPKS